MHYRDSINEAARARSEAHFAALNEELKRMSPKLIEMQYSRIADLYQPIKCRLDRNSDLFVTYVAARVYLTSLGTSITKLTTDNEFTWVMEFTINGSDTLYLVDHDDHEGYHFGPANGQKFRHARFADLIQAIMQTKESLTAQKH